MFRSVANRLSVAESPLFVASGFKTTITDRLGWAYTWRRSRRQSVAPRLGALLVMIAGLWSAGNAESFAIQTELQWDRTPLTANHGTPVPACDIVMDSANDVFITGRAYGGTLFGTSVSQTTTYVAKYLADGTLQWSDRQNGGICFGIDIDAAGNVLTTDGNVDRKYSASGDLLWQTSMGFICTDITADSAGYSYVTGRSDAWYPCVSKVDPNGNILWTSEITSLFQGICAAIEVDSEGNVTIGGHSKDINDGSGSLTNYGFAMKLDSDGDLLWAKQFGAEHRYSDVTSIAIDDSDAIYLAGHRLSADATALVKYDASGTQQWVRGVANDFSVMSLNTDPTGGVFISTLNGIQQYAASGTLLDSLDLSANVGSAFNFAYGNDAIGTVSADWSQSASYPDTHVQLHTFAPIPEPSTLILLGIGVIGLIGFVWRRR